MKHPFLDLEKYVQYCREIGYLSAIFSDSVQPFFIYRFVENLFVQCALPTVHIENISRQNVSYDAILRADNGVQCGVGVKTFVGQMTTGAAHFYKDEKVAELTTAASSGQFQALSVEALVEKVVDLRNKRILSEVGSRDLCVEDSFYHCLVRFPREVFIHEEAYPLIQWQNVEILPPARGQVSLDHYLKSEASGNIQFTDGEHLYKYSTAKNVLYKRFNFKDSYENPGENHRFSIEMCDDPFAFLERLAHLRLMGLFDLQRRVEALHCEWRDTSVVTPPLVAPTSTDDPLALWVPTSAKRRAARPFVILPLYSVKAGRKEVSPKSGINQWHAGGRRRKFGEAYIKIPKEVHRRFPSFFPPREPNGEKYFDVRLPNQQTVPCKVCQDNDKALMSRNNDLLARWIYQTIDGSFEKAHERFQVYEGQSNVVVREGVPYTYDDLLAIESDAVVLFEDETHQRYLMEAAPLDAYEFFMNSEAPFASYDDFLDQLQRLHRRKNHFDLSVLRHEAQGLEVDEPSIERDLELLKLRSI